MMSDPTPSAARADSEWQDRAECRKHDPDLWHSTLPGAVSEAKAICRECPVVKACLAQALADPKLTGVWGGTDDAERRDIRSRRSPKSLPPHGTPQRHGVHRRAGEKCAECASAEWRRAKAAKDARERASA